ncbi:MAG: hypothetical protein J0I02_12245, partial [Alphaproteobacteria bacterium]|nr:hypothetical protein [Alphaproteobacteria bacterium]
ESHAREFRKTIFAKDIRMKPIALIGVLLIVLGIAGLIFSGFSYTETKPVVEAGPLKVTTQEEHYVTIPNIASVLAILAGAALVFGSRRMQ